MVSLHIRHSALQTATWILAICMSEYSGVKIFNFSNLVCFFKESSAGQIKGLSGPDVARGPYFGDPWFIVPSKVIIIYKSCDRLFAVCHVYIILVDYVLKVSKKCCSQ